MTYRIWRNTFVIVGFTTILSTCLAYFSSLKFGAEVAVEARAHAFFLAIFISTPIAYYIQLQAARLTRQNNALRKLTTLDGMTGLLNRTYFMAQVQQKLENNQKEAVLLMIDADNFKNINDTHGHAAGDKAIKAIADQLFEIDSKNALAGRLGGEEFGLFLQNTSRRQGKVIAENLRRAIETIVLFSDKDRQFDLSISIGGATTANENNSDALLSHADANLYRAKSMGRNCTMFNSGDDCETFDHPAEDCRKPTIHRFEDQTNDPQVFDKVA